MKLPAVLWKEGDDAPQDASVVIEDATVVYLKFPDGFEVRLLMHELEALFDFAVEEVIRQEEEAKDAEATNVTDELPF